MYQVIILHGTFGTPFENWIPWLSQKLLSDGIRVLAPQLPTPEGQNYNTWFDVLNTYKDYFDRKNTIFVTHSISAVFAVRYLLQTQKHVKGFISVAGYTTLRNVALNTKFLEVISSFTTLPHPHFFSKYAKYRYQFLSNNDPYIEESELRLFGESIEAELKFIPDAGHFNTNAGYTTFDELYQLIHETLQQE